MTNFFLKILFITTTIALSSCASVKREYITSKIPHIQELEKQDHKFCSSLNLEFDKKDNYKSRLYWRCRLSMAKYKIITNPVSKKEINYNLEINDLIKAIALKVADTPESSLSQQNYKLDDIQHRKCVAVGFDFDVNDSIKSEDYFACRKALIDEQHTFPPFGNFDYLKHQNNSYNLGFVISSRIEKSLQKYKEAEEKYPTCIKFYNKPESFKKCLDALEASKKCFSEIEQKKSKKELDQKTACQKRSYLQFPESLLMSNDKKEEFARKGEDANYYNKQNLTAIGLTIDKFDSDQKRIDARNKKKKTKEDINSKKGLYSKFELTRLRQDYIEECQKETDNELKDYIEFLNKACVRVGDYRE